MMKNSKKLRSEIDQLEDELLKLQERKSEIQQSLNKLTEGYAAVDRENGSMDEIRSLKTDKDVLEDVLTRKRSKKKDLEQQLDAVIKEEAEEQQYQQVLKLANEAEELQVAYQNKLSELDDLLQNKISGIVRIRSDWLKKAKKFMRIADDLNPGFLRNTYRRLMQAGKGEEIIANQLVDKIENEEGVNCDAVMSNTVLNSQYYGINLRNRKNPEMFFTQSIQRMISGRHIPKLLKESEDG